MEVDSLFHNRNSAAAGCDHDLTGICKGTYCLDLDDALRLRSCKDTAVFARCSLGNKVTLIFLCLRFLCVEDTTNHLLRFTESIIVWIDNNLGQDRGNRFVNTAGDELSTDRILEVISDVTLAHGRADRHRSKSVIRMCFTEFIHCCVDHADLWSVTVGDDNTCAFFYKICNCFSSFSGSKFLFWKCCAKGFVTKSNNYGFFAHMDSSFLFSFGITWCE